MSRVVPDRLSLTSRDGKVDVIETPRRPERRRLPRYRMFESTSLQRRVRANQLIGPRVSPVAVCPVIRPLTDLSQKGFTLLVLTTLASLRRVFEGFTFVRLSDAHLHEIDLALFSNAHHHGSLPQQLGVVWDRLLKTDLEGPTLISHAAFHTISQSMMNS